MWLFVLIGIIGISVVFAFLAIKSANDAVRGLQCPLCDAFFDNDDPPHSYVHTMGRGIIVQCGKCHRTFDAVIPKWQDSKEIDPVDVEE